MKQSFTREQRDSLRPKLYARNGPSLPLKDRPNYRTNYLSETSKNPTSNPTTPFRNPSETHLGFLAIPPNLTSILHIRLNVDLTRVGKRQDYMNLRFCMTVENRCKKHLVLLHHVPIRILMRTWRLMLVDISFDTWTRSHFVLSNFLFRFPKVSFALIDTVLHARLELRTQKRLIFLHLVLMRILVDTFSDT